MKVATVWRMNASSASERCGIDLLLTNLDDLAGLLGCNCRHPRLVEALGEATKENPGCWTRRRAFAQVRHGSNIQLLPYSLVARRHCDTPGPREWLPRG